MHKTVFFYSNFKRKRLKNVNFKLIEWITVKDKKKDKKAASSTTVAPAEEPQAISKKEEPVVKKEAEKPEPIVEPEAFIEPEAFVEPQVEKPEEESKFKDFTKQANT